MSYSDATNRPAQGFEIIEEIVDALQAVSELTTAIGGAALIFEHRAPEPAGDRWKRVIVRQPIYPEGYRVNSAKLTGFRFDIMVEVQEQVEKPDQFLSQAHDVCYENLVGTSLTLTRGSLIGTIQPYTGPTAAAYDSDDHSFYSTASYVLSTKPV